MDFAGYILSFLLLLWAAGGCVGIVRGWRGGLLVTPIASVRADCRGRVFLILSLYRRTAYYAKSSRIVVLRRLILFIRSLFYGGLIVMKAVQGGCQRELGISITHLGVLSN
jgi:hypothetical protein